MNTYGVTFTDAYGNAISTTTKGAYITIGNQRIAYVELKGNLDLSSSLILSNPTAVLTTLNVLAQNNIDKFELMVPKVLEQTEISLCPNLATLAAVLPSCPGGMSLSATTPNAGVYALVKLDAPDYWYIDVSTTGIIAIGATQIPSTTVQTPIDATVCIPVFSPATELTSESEYAFTVQMTVTTSGNNGVTFRNEDNNNYFQLLFNNGTVSFSGKVNGAATVAQNSNIVAFTPELNKMYNLKVQVHGNLMRAKWWEEGSSEPASWMLYADDGRILSGGISLIPETAGTIHEANALYQNMAVSTCIEDDAISIQEINIQNLLNNNHAPVVSNISADQQHSDGFVNISYRLSDLESDYSRLAILEYSTTGAFAGEEQSITLVTTDTDSHGAEALSTTSGGVLHTVVWNAAHDLGGVSDASVYVRIKPADSLVSGEFAVSEPFAVDAAGPIITSLRAEQTLGSDTVTISYDINELRTDLVSLSVSLDGRDAWDRVSSISSSQSATAGNMHTTIIWDVGKALTNEELNAVRIRLQVADRYKNISNFAVSNTFAVDTKAPFGLANFHGQASDENSILWEWSPVASEANFGRYLIAYHAEGDELNYEHVTTAGNINGAIIDSNLGIMGTNSLLITGLKPDTTYYASISAYDTFGHEPTGLTAEFKTQPHTSVILAPEPESSLSSGKPTGVENNTNTETILPSTADNPPVAPTGGFKITIDENSVGTYSNHVTLGLNAGVDTETMAISNFADMHDAIQEPYALTKEWNLCAEDGATVANAACAGKHTVYVRFYTHFGISSKEVSDGITYTMTVPEEEATQNDTVPGGTFNNSGGGNGSGGGSGQPSSSANGGNVINGANATPNQSSPNNSGTGQVNAPNTPNESYSSNQSNSFTASNNQPTKPIILPPLSIPIINDLARAKESPILLVPQVAGIKQAASANTIELAGTSIPNTEVILFIHSDQVVMYSTKADHTGAWKFVHSQDTVNLAPGEHTIFAVTYDKGSNIKSKPSLVKTFEVKKSKLAEIRSYFHLPTTLLTLLIGLLAAIYLFRHRLNGPPAA